MARCGGVRYPGCGDRKASPYRVGLLIDYHDSSPARLDMHQRYLLYAEQNYAFSILRPLQAELLRRGALPYWFLVGNEINRSYLKPDEKRLDTVDEVKRWNPEAVLVPGNMVPSFIPGVKVALFHGFNVAKASRSDARGHFNIRGCFDLYCTQGPETTERFERLARRHGHFRVVETGWSALDPFFNEEPPRVGVLNARPMILFCSTFTPTLSSAPHLIDTVKELSTTGEWDWLVQFHPKMPRDVVDAYKALSGPHLQFVETDDVIPLLKKADVMLCDTSSMIQMFLALQKPVVTFRNQSRGSKQHLLDVLDPREIKPAILMALDPTEALLEKISVYMGRIHPYMDGRSSERVVDAVEELLRSGRAGLSRKPMNLFRNLKERRRLGYWKL